MSRLALTFLLVLFACGCDAQLSAYEPTEAPYALFAQLVPEADTQFVRVEPVRERATDTLRGPLQAQLLLDGPGRAVALRDSLLDLEDGRTGFLYWTTAPLEFGATYRLLATDARGRTTEAEIDLPARPVPVRLDPRSEPNRVVQEIRWQPAPPTPASFRLLLEVQADAAAAPVIISDELPGAQPVDGDTLTQSIELLQVARALRAQLASGGDPILRAIEVAGSWPAPEAATRIRNGHGRVSALISSSARWRPSPELAGQLGFRLPD